MRFRYILVVDDVPADVRLNEPWEITFKGRTNRRVLCRDLSEEEVEQRAVKRRGIYVESIATFRVQPKVDDVLLCLEAGRVPSDIPPDEETQSAFRAFIGSDGLLKKQILPLNLLPSYFQDFQHSITRELNDLAKEGFRILRWRLALQSSSDSFLHEDCSIQETMIRG